jgi:hypothetical protein
LALTIVTSGCATASQRFVAFPAKGQDATQLAVDQQDCEAIAKGHKGNPLTAAAMGGAIGGVASGAAGAAGGAIIGSIFGGAGRGAKAGGLAGLAVGAIGGAIQGVAANEARYNSIYRSCLAARGYTTGG